MADLKSQVREMEPAISAADGEAAAARAHLKSLMDSAKSENVDLTSGDAFARIDEAGKSYDAAKQHAEQLKANRNRLLEILAEDGGQPAAAVKGEERPASYGAAFIASEAYKSAKSRVLGSENTPIGATEAVKLGSRSEFKTTLTSAGAISPVADRQNLIVGKPQASLDFLSMINIAQTDSDVVEWLEETTLTNSAAETAEVSAFPESAIAMTKRTANVKAVGHFIPVTRRALADEAYLEGWVNDRLIDGVRRRLQTQVLSGGGTGEDLTGIYTNANIGSVDRSDTSLGMIDSLHRCITTVRVNAFAEPTFIGIHPQDYEALVIQRAGGSTTTDGPYLYGNPVTGGAPTIWGVPAVVHAAFTSGTPLVGVGSEATLWVREGVSVSASDSHSDFFTKRIVTLLAETRVAFGVTQPKAFCKSVA